MLWAAKVVIEATDDRAGAAGEAMARPRFADHAAACSVPWTTRWGRARGVAGIGPRGPTLASRADEGHA